MESHVEPIPGAPSAHGPGSRILAIAELIRAVGGALLAFTALVALVGLSWIGLDKIESSARGEAFVAVVGAISTIVGGYVGAKIGASGKEDAERVRDEAVRKGEAATREKEQATRDIALLMGQLNPSEAEAAQVRLESLGR